MCPLLVGRSSGRACTRPGLARPPACEGLASDARGARCQNFAGAVTRTRTSTPTTPIKHHRDPRRGLVDAGKLAHAAVMAARRPAATPKVTEPWSRPAVKIVQAACQGRTRLRSQIHRERVACSPRRAGKTRPVSRFRHTPPLAGAHRPGTQHRPDACSADHGVGDGRTRE